MVKKHLATLKRLPASMCRGIGRIMVADSYLDLALIQIVYKLTGVGQKEGRLAIREPRTVERLEMILDLAKVHSIEIQTDVNLLRDTLTRSTSNRDLAGHGIWFRADDGRILVRQTRGQWNEGGKKTSRKILPKGEPVDEDELDIMLQITESAIGMVEELDNEVATALAASPRKPQ
jgi:hypothetical protein